MPRPAERPSDGGKAERPDQRREQRQRDERDEPGPEHPGRYRDERPCERRQPPDEKREHAVTLEPALRAGKSCRRDVQPPPVALDQRTASAPADPPADQRAEERSERACDGQHHIALDPMAEGRPEERRMTRPHDPRRDHARVEHHELTADRQQRINRHQGEHGGHPVRGDPTRQLSGDARHHRRASVLRTRFDGALANSRTNRADSLAAVVTAEADTRSF